MATWHISRKFRAFLFHLFVRLSVWLVRLTLLKSFQEPHGGQNRIHCVVAAAVVVISVVAEQSPNYKILICLTNYASNLT